MKPEDYDLITKKYDHKTGRLYIEFNEQAYRNWKEWRAKQDPVYAKQLAEEKIRYHLCSIWKPGEDWSETLKRVGVEHVPETDLSRKQVERLEEWHNWATSLKPNTINRVPKDEGSRGSHE